MQFVGTFWALVPPIIAITLALITSSPATLPPSPRST